MNITKSPRNFRVLGGMSDHWPADSYMGAMLCRLAFTTILPLYESEVSS